MGSVIKRMKKKIRDVEIKNKTKKETKLSMLTNTELLKNSCTNLPNTLVVITTIHIIAGGQSFEVISS